MDPKIRRFRRHNILHGECARALSQAPVALGYEPQMTAQGELRMTIQVKILCAMAVSGFAAFAAMSPAQALTTQECSAKYQAAKTAGTLAGQKWNDFSKANCGAEAAAAAAPKEAKKEAARSVAAAPSGPAVYPSAVDSKYAKEPAGKARMHTCVDQYNANKTTNGNGGLKWIQKGGGYYSECTKKLKGAA